MGDAATLREKLSKTDMSQPGIQGSAAAMMKLYDRAAPLAVSEWRAALQTCRLDQLLPLLYVANEVLQTSKRNRGPKFLEAFGEVLGSSLRFICERDRSIVEKVRRTAKIWGDRQVYSTRFVGQLLAGLEDMRGGGGGAASSPSPPKAASSSPSAAPSTASAADEKKRSVADEEERTDGDDEDNSFSSPFGSSGGHSLLSIDISASAAAAAGAPGGTVGSKRRRSSRSSSPVPGGKGSSSSQKRTKNKNSNGKKPAKKKKVAKSTSALVALLDSLTACDARFRSSQGTIDSIEASHLNDSEDALADVVGDELADLNFGAAAAARTLKRQQRALRGIASEKRMLEGEVTSYIPWLVAALKADEEELGFCDKLEKSLEAIGIVHAEAKDARQKRRKEEAGRRAQEEAERRAKEAEEERKRLLEEAMKTPNQEAKHMKWNPALREYQYVGDVTEESWRD